MSLLVITQGQHAGRRVPLLRFPVTLGRDSSNSVALPQDEEVSRFHACIKRRERIYVVEDLDSRNGTFLNGDRVINAVLRNGDRILIGATEIVFHTAEPQIRIATELLQFDLVLAPEAGLKGPIEVDPNAEPIRDQFAPQRLPAVEVGSPSDIAIRELRAIVDFHGNILLAHTLEEAAANLLKYLAKMFPAVSRAAMFAWIPQSRQLVPIGARHFKRKQPFLISQRALEDTLARRHGVWLPAGMPNVTQSGRNRIILPVCHLDVPVAVVHIEVDNPRFQWVPAALDAFRILCDRCAPILQTMLLRKEIDAWTLGVIEVMIATVEAKDTYTRGHSERVSRYCMAIADELKLTRDLKQLLLASAICHDIGKVGIPDAILKKASLLSAEEYEEMKMHPVIGAEIISHMPNAHRFLSGVKYHHEKWDGTGYPEGLAGEDIPFFGRIVGVADVFDAMVSGRSYSGFMDEREAVERLANEKDLFDPTILRAFVRAFEHGTLSLKTDTQNRE